MANGKKDQAAQLLASGESVRGTAERLGIGERTLYTWLEDAEYRRQVSELRGQLLANGLGRLSDNAASAANVLRDLLGSESEGIRLAAARSVLSLANDLRKCIEQEQAIAELSQRLDQIEKRAEKETK